MLDQTWQHMDIPEFDNDAAFLMWAYQDMLRVGGAEFGAALGLIANAGITPMVFHCAAGKDRTGILAALTRRVQWQP